MLMGKKTIGTLAPMLGVPFTHAEFAWSFAQLIQYNSEYVCEPGQVIHLVKPTQTYHAAARNQLVKDMLGDWLFMLDCDHAFAPDILARMLYLMNTLSKNGEQIDILSAMYHYRLPPHGPSAFHWNEKHTGFVQLGDWAKEARVIQVDATGAGTLLVRKSVFERINRELGEEPFSVIHPWSEDYSFFVRAEKLGIRAFVAPKIQSLHLMTRPLSTEDYTDRMAEVCTPVEVIGYGLEGKRM